MSTELRRSLERVEHALASLGRTKLLEALGKGVEPAVTRHMLSTLGMAPSPELEVLYEWRNGTVFQDSHVLGDVWIFPGFFFQSQEDLVAGYGSVSEHSRWHPDWFAAFANGGGDFYVVDLDDREAGAVRRFEFDQVELPIEFRSLTDMFRTIAEAFDRHVIFVDDDGHLEMNDAEFGMLAAWMNPAVPSWRS